MPDGNDKQYLYHNSTFALNADTGEIVWYYQHIVDHWDLDHPFERLLIDTAVAPDASQVAWINPKVRPGEVRKVLTGIPGKTGIILHARPQNRGVSMGTAHCISERRLENRRRDGEGNGES
ncbi:MAG: hypothetical protein ABI824_13260 [Acidobacteriota bacterium]